MKYYLAPMEGITGYIYRNAYAKSFNNIDKYFTPFIVPNESKSLKTKEFKDMLPENNVGLKIIPQILTDDAQGFKFTCNKLKQLGYEEVNLNLGCPSSIVVSKGRGSGFLARKKELEAFLDEIYKIEDMKISIKTRIGKDSPDEFYQLLDIYNKYPLEELIIHPRTQKDFYGNKPNLEVFKDALSLSKHSICYNGDIFTVEDHDNIKALFNSVDKMMLGRGILANPGLMHEIKNSSLIDKQMLAEFHEEIFQSYREFFGDDRYALFRMKELWGYMIYIFSNSKEYSLAIKKSQNVSEYNQAVLRLLKEQEIVAGAGLFSKHD